MSRRVKRHQNADASDRPDRVDGAVKGRVYTDRLLLRRTMFIDIPFCVFWTGSLFCFVLLFGFEQVVSCTRTKDRGRYLPEWVAYHWAMGVDEMNIFDDDSVDDTREVRILV
ncbi:expressed unknown protein [Ectocarpus siliculosus]|uniref:Uncharacterized protein n=1 Tax=Ectocarpus siliculosus TaxID=2880 RepID=D8LG84_ECTSI|nr:expressed unknown protein [Ectocarpus siliculosus]|eukprot:CBN78983.1 expressed unknown protein [Ectocarpus siliculosus]